MQRRLANKEYSHYFILQLFIATSCRLVYRINVAHLVDRPHGRWSRGGKCQTIVA
jgi:hypothetical protein